MNGADEELDERGMPESLTGKILALGLGAYFMTEDAVRRYVKDAKIPRDIARSITQNATKGKDELYGFVARELSTFLRQMDVQEEMHRFVAKHKIRISAEIEFVPRGEEAEEPAREGAAPASGDESTREGSPLEWDLRVRLPRTGAPAPGAPGAAAPAGPSPAPAPTPATSPPATPREPGPAAARPPEPRPEPGDLRPPPPGSPPPPRR